MPTLTRRACWQLVFCSTNFWLQTADNDTDDRGFPDVGVPDVNVGTTSARSADLSLKLTYPSS